MSSLTYNGVRVDLMTTGGIEHVPVRADDGSYLYTKVSIDVAGMIYGTPPATGAVAAPVNRTLLLGTRPTAIIQGIRSALMQERGQLVYDLEDGAAPLVFSPALGPDNAPLPCDCNNGPVPEVMALSHVAGINACSVRFRVTTWVKECPGYAGPNGPDALLSNRSYQTHSISEQHLTTIETVGQAVFRTDVLEQARQQADHYRYLLFGPVPKGCKRVAANIQATPARNTLTYRYVDQERHFDLGETGPTGSNSGIVDVKFVYGTSSTGQAGAPISPVTAHRAKVTVVGNKSASHWAMTKAAFAVAQTKLPIFDPTKGFLTQVSVDQVMHDRVVELNAVMMLHADNGGGAIPGLNVDALRFDAVFADRGGANPAFPARGGTAGTYQNELLTTAWKGACAPPTKDYAEGPYTGADDTPYDSPDTGPIVAVTVDDSPEPPALPPQYSAAQGVKPYVRYKLDVKVQGSTGTVQAPLAGAVTVASPGAPAGGSSGSPTADTEGDGGGGGAGPGGEDPPTCVFLTLARPVERLLAEFAAERIGAPPSVPAFTSTDPNRVLLDSYIQVAEPQLMTDGVSWVYAVMGRATYGLKRPLGAGSPLAFPASPMHRGGYGDQLLSAGDFVSGIIDPAG